MYECAEHPRIVSRCSKCDLGHLVDAWREPIAERCLKGQAQRRLLRHDAAAEDNALRIDDCDDIGDCIRKRGDERGDFLCPLWGRSRA